MVIDLICETSERIPWSVPVLIGLCRGIVIVWVGGPACRNLTWLPFWRMTVYPRCSNARIRRSEVTPRGNFMRLRRELIHL
jgi:hypothetical protein